MGMLPDSHCHEAIEIRGTNHVDAFKSWYEGGPTRIWFSEECQTKFSSPECPEKDG